MLGVVFLAGTAFEWRDLIYRHHLTISRNLFGTTYYTLVGLHATHVTVGVTIMLIVLGLAVSREVTSANRSAVGLVSWYWHFVDVQFGWSCSRSFTWSDGRRRSQKAESRRQRSEVGNRGETTSPTLAIDI